MVQKGTSRPLYFLAFLAGDFFLNPPRLGNAICAGVCACMEVTVIASSEGDRSH